MSDEHTPAAQASSGPGTQPEVYNRNHLIADVAEACGLPRPKATAAVDAVLASAGKALQGGKEVRLTGFGVFNVSERKAGKGRDPRTGAEIDIPHSKSVRFRPGKSLRDKVADTTV